MSSPRKPRGDAHLKTLPENRQEAIVEYLRGHTLEQAVAWLKADGLRTSSGALSLFWSWWQLREQLAANESTVESILADMKRENPELTDEQLFSAGQRFFTALAIEQKDSLAWKRAVDAKAKAREIKLLERRVALLERKAEQADRAKATVADVNLSEEEKQARLKQIFGMA